MPKKHLGQHFLSDPHILRKIVDFSRVGSQDTVVEIGPGKGTLTQTLAERVRRVVTIEIDPDLVRSLRTRISSNVEIIEGDALEIDFTRLSDSPYHVVANLPYNVATPLIERFTKARGSIASVTIMLQKEVADRILAGPGSRQYGVLSVGIQYYAGTEGGFRVPPGAFTPKPKVWSRMIRMTWHAEIVDSPDFMLFVKQAFSSRRKKLVNNLVPSFPGHGRDRLLEIFEREGVPPDARAENLPVDAFIRLHHALVYNLDP